MDLPLRQNSGGSCRQMQSANDILQKTGTTLNKTHPTKQKWTNNSFHNTQETSTLLKMISSFLRQQVMLAKLLTFNSHEYQPADYTGTSELAHCIRLTIQRSQVWALQWPPTQYLFDRFHFHGPAGETLPPLLGVKSDWTGKLTHVMYNKTKLVIHFADSVCAKEFALNL